MDREKTPNPAIPSNPEPGGALASFGEDVCGETLTDLREKAGLLQEQLAALLGRSRSTINAWENAGKRTPLAHRKGRGRCGLTPARLLEIAIGLGYTAEDVLRSLRYHQDLRPGKPLAGCAADPLAPAEMEARTLDYTTLQMDGLVRRQFRKAKLDGLLAAASEKLQLLLSSERALIRSCGSRRRRKARLLAFFG